MSHAEQGGQQQSRGCCIYDVPLASLQGKICTVAGALMCIAPALRAAAQTACACFTLSAPSGQCRSPVGAIRPISHHGAT